MNGVYIFGIGQGLSYVKRCLQKNVHIFAYIDNYSESKHEEDGIAIVRQEELIGASYDYVLVTLVNYEEIRRGLVEQLKVDPLKIVCFFDREDADKNVFDDILEPAKWKTELLWKYQREVVEPYLYNRYYEINEKELLSQRKIPEIIDPASSVRYLIEHNMSLVRFGDGEFELMSYKKRSRFQDIDEGLAVRLKSIIMDQESDIMIAIADNYGNLDKYTDKAAEAIRFYLSPDIREQHMSFLNLDRSYFNAYLSRPYLMYRDKRPDTINKKFELLREIWDGKNILIVEGNHTRFGVGNDLINNAKDVKRILAPDNNAFLKYDNILAETEKHGKNRLVLCILGPTATVLAYDLALSGYQAVDIGQLDTEYEWFLRGMEYYCDIPYKTVSDYTDKSVYSDMSWELQNEYKSQIVSVIE